jgi:3-methyladenine DNA glycosylase AlkC
MEPLKEHFSLRYVERLRERVIQCLAVADASVFTRITADELNALELKARVTLLANTLVQTINAPSPEILFDHIVRLVQAEPRWQGFDIWPFATVLELHAQGAPAAALLAQKAVTPWFTCEFAVRPLLKEQPEFVLNQFQEWAHDPDEHVRRWTSEGSRARLPWGGNFDALLQNPTLTRDILETLRNDASDYVRRSVANHLNDLTREHAGYVLDVAETWMQNPGPRTAATLRHALRNLIKAGHPRALALFGSHKPELAHVRLEMSASEARVGDSIHWKLYVETPPGVQTQRLIIDYALWHRKASGGLSPKVFKGTVINLAPARSTVFHKKHSLRPITTRNYYTGQHELHVMINGQTVARGEFMLHAESIEAEQG